MRRIRSPYSRLAAALTLVTLLAPVDGRAEGLLEFLFGADPTPAPAPSAPAAPAPRARARKAVGDVRVAKPREGGAGGFCVRTCDGYYFPLIKSSRATRQQSCEFACPSAPMEIYDGATIEQARNSKGQRYSSLPVAFAFRDRATRECLCNDPQSSQAYFQNLARTDPTLRSGDVVVEDSGAFVYSGSALVPLRSASFVPATARARLRALLRGSPSAKAALSEAIAKARREPEIEAELSTVEPTGAKTP